MAETVKFDETTQDQPNSTSGNVSSIAKISVPAESKISLFFSGPVRIKLSFFNMGILPSLNFFYPSCTLKLFPPISNLC